MNGLTSGQVAERAGIGVEALRFYERRGLIPEPPRAENGYRQFPPDTVDRIRFIRRAQQIGFSLAEIADLLELRVDPEADCGAVRARALTKLEEVEAKIDDLQRIRSTLAELADACVRGGPSSGDCPILRAIEPAPAD